MRNPVRLFVSLLILLTAFVAFAEPPQERLPQRRRPVPQQQASDAGTPVRHETKYHAVPDSKLEVRAVEYNGHVNGTLTVQVHNAGKAAQKFSAAGLYFVPEGNPDTAPQRLGAVGPMQIATEKNKEVSELEIAPGATVEVQLAVFCIDSQRPAPGPTNSFNVGATKMPKELTTQIENRANDAVQAAKVSGSAAPRPAAQQSIQSEVWKSRDSKWVPLDGEGRQEVGKKK